MKSGHWTCLKGSRARKQARRGNKNEIVHTSQQTRKEGEGEGVGERRQRKEKECGPSGRVARGQTGRWVGASRDVP